jgi:hypothetical protein
VVSAIAVGAKPNGHMLLRFSAAFFKDPAWKNELSR